MAEGSVFRLIAGEICENKKTLATSAEGRRRTRMWSPSVSAPYLCKEHGVDKSRIRAARYWRRGDVSFPENIND